MTLCTLTGLELVKSPPPGNFRIARTSFGPLTPKLREREPDGTVNVEEWGRFDTLGRTLYSTDDRVTSFMELLAPYRTEINGARRALQKDADAMGIPLEEYWNMVVADWDEAGTMRARWLPKAWREGRAIYQIRYPAGWWVDISATSSLAALSAHLEDQLMALGVTGGLTVAHLAGEDRIVTTLIAAWLRNDARLFDGSQPLGVRFVSKHGHPEGGSGTCWAYWMRSEDTGQAEQASVIGEAPIGEGDADLELAQSLCKIRTR